MDAMSEQVAELRRTSRLVVRALGFMSTTFCDTGLSHSMCHALIELEASGELELRELSERLTLDKSSASRMVAQMARSEWVRMHPDERDRRRKPVELTAAGRRKLAQVHRTANEPVQAALELLTPEERATVVEGMALYARSLAKARTRAEFDLRPARKGDDRALKALIHTVMPEFGACGEGFSIQDAEVSSMYGAYSQPGHAYFVLTHNDRVVGGAGVGPLKGGSPDTCELRKMYFLSEARGRGLGRVLLQRCLEEARALGYRTCYLETLKNMHQARRLYESAGFKELSGALGKTGHHGCDCWYSLGL